MSNADGNANGGNPPDPAQRLTDIETQLTNLGQQMQQIAGLGQQMQQLINMQQQ